jgi:hypothetical protein
LSTRYRSPSSIITGHTPCSIILRPYTSPSHQTSAKLLFRIIGSFPEMILRNETLPPFIHSTYFQTEQNDNAYTTGSSPLVACRCLAQIFSNRNKENSGFLWSMVKAESERLRNEVRGTQATGLWPLM